MSVAIAALLIGCSAVPPPAHPLGALYSWKPPDGEWRFVVRPGASLRNDREVTAAHDAIIGVAAFKRYIASLPPRTSLSWRDNPPSEVITYPDYHIRDDIMNFARLHHVWITVLPSIYDKT